MGLWTRVKRSVRALFGGIIERTEDPELILQQTIRDMRDRVPEMEYVFCDTEKELTETYEYLNRVEAFLGKKIVRLNAKAGFDHWLDVFGGYLPSPQMRWCT